MSNITHGLVAGFVATVVLTVMLVAKSMMGLMPALDPIMMLAAMMGMPIVVGWLGHFMIGTVAWGGLFAILGDRIPGDSNIARGATLGVAAWLAMMIVIMPMAGAGAFGMAMGIMAPMMTLLMHVVFGVVLGWVYGRLNNTQGVAA